MSMATIRDSVRFWLHDGTGSPPVSIFSDPDIDRFLALEAVVDIDGYHPEQTGWTPTYNVKRAAGWGWIWLGGLASNKPLSYKAGDVQVNYDKTYCLNKARELMGSATATATRVDEPYQEQHRKKYYDGDPGMES